MTDDLSFPVAPRTAAPWVDELTKHLRSGAGALRAGQNGDHRRRAEQHRARRRLRHRTQIDAHTDPLFRAAAAGDYFRAVLAQMHPEDGVRFVAEYVDTVLHLVDQMEGEPDDHDLGEEPDR